MGNITIRMNDDLKARVNQTLDAMGMNFNTYVTMASIQLVNQQRLPFDTSVRTAEPNEQTKCAMLETEAKERGIPQATRPLSATRKTPSLGCTTIPAKRPNG